MARIFRAILRMESGMSWSIILLVLGAALLHAAWNIIVKGGQNKLFETAMNALGGGLGAMLILPFLHFPDRAAWGLLAPFLRLPSHLLHMHCGRIPRCRSLPGLYNNARHRAHAHSPWRSASWACPFGLAGWGGVLLLCAGIFTLALEQKLSHKGSLKGILYAPANILRHHGLYPWPTAMAPVFPATA